MSHPTRCWGRWEGHSGCATGSLGEMGMPGSAARPAACSFGSPAVSRRAADHGRDHSNDDSMDHVEHGCGDILWLQGQTVTGLSAVQGGWVPLAGLGESGCCPGWDGTPGG